MKRRIDRMIRLLIVLNILAVAGLAAVLLVSLIQRPAGHPEQAGNGGTVAAASAASPGASATPETIPMGLAHIPTNNACVLCHESGGAKGVKVVPAIVHPLEGWRQCLTCHTNESLGRKAPGHDGIAEGECLNCHRTAPEGPSITQPHSDIQDQKCLDCHGTYAHLPSSMASRNETTCTLCHKPTEIAPPEYPHQANARLGCRSCHDSPEVGNLPIDHALRTDSTCLLCHNIITVDEAGRPVTTGPVVPGASGAPAASPLPSLPTPGSLPTPAPSVTPAP